MNRDDKDTDIEGLKLPLANPKLFAEVAKSTDFSPNQVKDIMEFVFRYTCSTIEKPSMESVLLPGFGKFRPKLKHLQALHHIQINQGTSRQTMYYIKREINKYGTVLSPIPSTNPNETICDRHPDQPDQSEQGMDVPSTGI